MYWYLLIKEHGGQHETCTLEYTMYVLYLLIKEHGGQHETCTLEYTMYVLYLLIKEHGGQHETCTLEYTMYVLVLAHQGACAHTSTRRKYVASFPGLHHSFCRLQYENRGEGLEGFCTLTSRIPLIHTHSIQLAIACSRDATETRQTPEERQVLPIQHTSICKQNR